MGCFEAGLESITIVLTSKDIERIKSSPGLIRNILYLNSSTLDGHHCTLEANISTVKLQVSNNAIDCDHVEVSKTNTTRGTGLAAVFTLVKSKCDKNSITAGEGTKFYNQCCKKQEKVAWWIILAGVAGGVVLVVIVIVVVAVIIGAKSKQSFKQLEKSKNKKSDPK